MDFLLSEKSKLNNINKDNNIIINELCSINLFINNEEETIKSFISKNIMNLEQLQKDLHKNKLLFESVVETLYKTK